MRSTGAAGRSTGAAGRRVPAGVGSGVLVSLAAVVIVLGVALVARAETMTVSPAATRADISSEPDLRVADWSTQSLDEISPGSPGYWFVDAWVVGADGARLTLELRKDGELMELPDGLTVTVERCGSPWADVQRAPSCAGPRVTVARAGPSDDFSTSSPVYQLDAVDAQELSHMMVTLGLPDTPASRSDESLMGLTGSLALGITAVGSASDEPASPAAPRPAGPPPGATGGPGLLPVTGAAATMLLWFAGAALVVGGVVTVATVARRHPRAGAQADGETGADGWGGR